MVREIDKSEYEQRISRVKEEMSKRELDALFVYSNQAEPQNVQYLSGLPSYWEPAAVFVPLDRDPTLVIGPEAGRFAHQTSKIRKIVRVPEFVESAGPEYPDFAPTTRLKDVLSSAKIRKMGLVGYYLLPASKYLLIRRILRETKIEFADDIIDNMKLVKSENELEIMRQACKLADSGMEAAIRIIRTGVSEREIFAEAAYTMIKGGGGTVGNFINSGPNSALDFTNTTDRKVKEGEVIQINLGVNVGGYTGSLARPVVIGRIPEEMVKFIEAGREASQVAMDTMESGIEAKVVADAVKTTLTRSGYIDCWKWGPAHGTGIFECEPPFLETTSKYVLEPNMTFNIDLFMSDDEKGFRFEDGVRTTANGVERLSHFPHKVVIL